MGLKEELIEVVNASKVKDDPKTLEEYSRDQSFVAPRRPDYVVFTENVEQVQKVVRIANKYLTPITVSYTHLTLPTN